MANSDFQPVALGEIVPKVILPCCIGRAVAAAIVGKNENATSMGIALRSILFPPSANGVDGECGGVMAEPDRYGALVGDRIIDAVGYDFGGSLRGEVMVADITGLVTPDATWVFEVPDEFLLFCVDTDDRFLLSSEVFTQTTDMAKLQVAFGTSLP